MPNALRTPGLAWRTAALLAAAAMLPLAFAAWLSAVHAQALLTAHSHARSAEAAQRHAAVIQARLRAADAALRERLRQLDWTRVTGAAAPEGGRTPFAFIGVLRADGMTRALHGGSRGMPEVPAAARAHLAAGNALLLTLPQAGQPARVFLLRALGGAHPAGSLLAAELDLAYLWESAPASASELQHCVLSVHGETVNCIGGPAPGLLPGAGAAQSGSLDWLAGGERFLASYGRLPLAAELATPDWLVFAGERRGQALAQSAPLWRVLALTLLCGAALAALLGALHVRSRLRALHLLGAATRRIADAQLAGDLELPREPEFAALSTILREMASSAGLDQTVRTALADIDTHLLQRADLDQVARRLVSRLRAILPAEAVALVVKSQSNAQVARLYVASGADIGAVQGTSVPFLPPVGEQRLLASDGLWLQHPLPADPVLAVLEGHGARDVLLVPVVWNRMLAGMLVLGFAGREALSARAQSHLRQFANRLAIAFSASMREEQLLYQSRFDALTGLPNRQTFMERLSYEEARARRDGSLLAVMLVNLDQFKSVNDTLGHGGGDDVIRQAAARLKEFTRGGDAVARVGGDEFALLLTGLPAAAEVARVGAQLMRNLSAPFLSGEHERVLTASVGVAVYPADAETAAALVRNADTAMHRAKEAGGGRVVFFEERMNQEVYRRVTVERELRRAIERDEFVLYYQPQMDARTGALSGAEVLIRWQHPARGLQSPAAFIGIAEQTGLIEPIGELVLRKACLQLQAWHSQRTAPPRLSVNVSGRQFRRRDFAALVATILRETGTDPKTLELEITETLLMEDADASGVVLNQLAEQGIRLAIDDFGTGYSSLAYLKRLRFDALKIDRSFVKDVTTDEDSAAICAAVIALARTLRKETVAEGVETQEQLDFLRGHQCDLIQGFLISRPVPAGQFISALLANVNRTRSALRLAASR
jgi:diguanylate cyclase (GGDEF)-like protein